MDPMDTADHIVSLPTIIELEGIVLWLFTFEFLVVWFAAESRLALFLRPAVWADVFFLGPSIWLMLNFASGQEVLGYELKVGMCHWFFC